MARKTEPLARRGRSLGSAVVMGRHERTTIAKELNWRLGKFGAASKVRVIDPSEYEKFSKKN